MAEDRDQIANRALTTEFQLPDYASPVLRIMLDDRLFDRVRLFAKYMAKAYGLVPRHCIDNLETCFAITSRALTWKLDPFAVAACTYVVGPKDDPKIGYEGKLVAAVLENSGKLRGGVKFEHFGDWSAIAGAFKIQKSERGKEYAVATWTQEQIKKLGLGVKVSAEIIGEGRREWSLMLEQCFPRNSTLWALDPKTQICYTGARRFANVVAPGIFMGIPFDVADFEPTGVVIDAEPEEAPAAKPKRSDYRRTPEPEEAHDDGGEPADNADNAESGNEPDREAGAEASERLERHGNGNRDAQERTSTQTEPEKSPEAATAEAAGERVPPGELERKVAEAKADGGKSGQNPSKSDAPAPSSEGEKADTAAKAPESPENRREPDPAPAPAKAAKSKPTRASEPPAPRPEEWEPGYVMLPRNPTKIESLRWAEGMRDQIRWSATVEELKAVKLKNQTGWGYVTGKDWPEASALVQAFDERLDALGNPAPEGSDHA